MIVLIRTDMYINLVTVAKDWVNACNREKAAVAELEDWKSLHNHDLFVAAPTNTLHELQKTVEDLRGKKLQARASLLSFYDELPNAEEFSQVSRACFKEIPDRVRNERQKAVDKEKQEAFKRKFHVMGAPPPPPPAESLASP